MDVNQLVQALRETVYMSFISLLFAIVFGLIIGVILYATQSGNLFQNKLVNRCVDVIVNVLRAVPFIILLFLLIPFAKFLTGSMLGATAALPALIVAASPFYARMCVIAFSEVDRGVIEASKAMGASRLQIIYKVLSPEALPALISGAAVTGISLISYTAMAGALGSGGLGNLAYLYGFARRNEMILYTATILIVLIVFVIQAVGDKVVKKIDKR